MTNFRKLNRITTKLITSAGVLALITGISISMPPTAYALDCLLDTNNDGNADSNVDTDGGASSFAGNFALACGFNASAAGAESTALGRSASAAGTNSTALGSSTSAAGTDSTALGRLANAAGVDSTALGRSSSAAGLGSTALGRDASAADNASTALGRLSSAAGNASTAVGHGANAAADDSTALGRSASAAGASSTALGSVASAAGILSTAVGNEASAAGEASIALGGFANAAQEDSTALGFGSDAGLRAIALGGDSLGDVGNVGAQALGDNSIVIGVDAADNSFADTVVIGFGASATEIDQVILKSADTFTILGNGDVGIGTAAPLANLDINSGAADTTLLLNNSSAQWELKSKASTGRLNFKNLIAGGVPFKLGPSAVNSLLSVGTMADDLVEVRGELMVEGDVDVTGTLTTGGPTCGGGCDAVFGADYDLPTIEEHAAAMYANSYLPEIGPTVPKAAINVTERMGTMLNELEKAHIYIAQQEARLNRHEQEKQAMQAEITQLKAIEMRVLELEKRLE